MSHIRVCLQAEERMLISEVDVFCYWGMQLNKCKLSHTTCHSIFLIACCYWRKLCPAMSARSCEVAFTVALALRGQASHGFSSLLNLTTTVKLRRKIMPTTRREWLRNLRIVFTARVSRKFVAQQMRNELHFEFHSFSFVAFFDFTMLTTFLASECCDYRSNISWYFFAARGFAFVCCHHDFTMTRMGLFLYVVYVPFSVTSYLDKRWST